MKPVEFGDGIVQVDAAVVAEGLGIALPRFQKEMRAGRITGVFERGVGADRGRHRLTFFSPHRRVLFGVRRCGALVLAAARYFWGWHSSGLSVQVWGRR